MADEKKTVKVTADVDIQTDTAKLQKIKNEVVALNKELEILQRREENLRREIEKTPADKLTRDLMSQYESVQAGISSRQKRIRTLSSKVGGDISQIPSGNASVLQKEIANLDKEAAALYSEEADWKKVRNQKLKNSLKNTESKKIYEDFQFNPDSFIPLSKKEKGAQRTYEKFLKEERKIQIEKAQKEAYIKQKAGENASAEELKKAQEKYGNVSKRTFSKIDVSDKMPEIEKKASLNATLRTQQEKGLQQGYDFKSRAQRAENYALLSEEGQKIITESVKEVKEIQSELKKGKKKLIEYNKQKERLAEAEAQKPAFLGYSDQIEKEAQNEQSRINREQSLQKDLRNPRAYNTSRAAIQRRSGLKFGDNKTLPAYLKTVDLIKESLDKGGDKPTHEEVQTIFESVLNESDLKIMSDAKKQGAPVDKNKGYISRNGYGTFVGDDGRIVKGGYKNEEGELIPAQSYKINSENYLKEIGEQGFKLGKKGKVSLFEVDEFYSYINDQIAIESKKAGPEAQKEVQKLTKVANTVVEMVTEAVSNTNLESVKNGVISKISATQKSMMGEDYEPNAPFVRNSPLYRALQARYAQSPSDFDMSLVEQNKEKVPQYDNQKVRKDEIKESKAQSEAIAEANNRAREFGEFMNEDLASWLRDVLKEGGAKALNEAIQLIVSQFKDQTRGSVQDSEYGTISLGGDFSDIGKGENGSILTVASNEKFDEDRRETVYGGELLDKEIQKITATEEELTEGASKINTSVRSILKTIIDFVRDAVNATDSLDEKAALGELRNKLERRFYRGEGNEEKSLEQNFQESFNRTARFLVKGKVLKENWEKEAETNGTTPIQEMNKTLASIEDDDEREKYTQEAIASMSAWTRFQKALGEDGSNIEKAVNAFFEGGGKEIEEIYRQFQMFSNNPQMVNAFYESVLREVTPRTKGANGEYMSPNKDHADVVPRVEPRDSSFKMEGTSPKERFIQLWGQGQDVLGTFGTTDPKVGLERANKRLNKLKSRQAASEEKILAAQKVIEETESRYESKTTKSGTRVKFDKPLWSFDTDLTEEEIKQQAAQDKREYKKAQQVLTDSSDSSAEIVNLERKIALIEEAIQAQKELYSVKYTDGLFEGADTENEKLEKQNELIDKQIDLTKETIPIEENKDEFSKEAEAQLTLPEPDYESLYEDMNFSFQEDSQNAKKNAQAVKENESEVQSEIKDTVAAEEQKKQAVENTTASLERQAEEATKAAEEAQKVKNTFTGKPDFKDIDDLPWSIPEDEREDVQRVIEDQNEKWRKDAHRENQSSWIRNPLNKGFGVGVSAEDILDSVENKPAEENLDWKKGIREYEAATQNIVKALGQIYEAKLKIEQIQEDINKIQNDENILNKEQLITLEAQKTAEENKLSQAQVAYQAASKRKEESGIREQVRGDGSTLPMNLARQVQQIDNYADSQLREMMANIKAKATYQTQATQNKGTNSYIASYLNQYKQILALQVQIDANEKRMAGMKGEQAKNQQVLIDTQKRYLAERQASLAVFDSDKGTLNGVPIEDEQALVNLKRQKANLDSEAAIKMEKNNKLAKQQVGFVQQIAEGFRASLRNLTDYSMAYAVIGKIKQTFSQIIQYAKQLNSEMVNLQIASGYSHDEIKSMMYDFNNLAKEVGKSTQEVAQAANEWLRAGYQGQEASELTQASMYLSTLGMIESSEATSYLISVLKGWKIEAGEVMEVVDKLTVTICSVCRVIGIGHKLKSR